MLHLNFLSISSLSHRISILSTAAFSAAVFCFSPLSNAVAADEQKAEEIKINQTEIVLEDSANNKWKARRKVNTITRYLKKDSAEQEAAEQKNEDAGKQQQEETAKEPTIEKAAVEIEKIEKQPEAKLPPEITELFESITADSLPSKERPLNPKFSVEIERGNVSNPFPENGGNIPVEKRDKGLQISIKERDTSNAEYLQTAKEAFSAGQVESAVAYYKKVLAKDSENRAAKFGLATTYHRSGQLDQARDMYIDLISINQNDWDVMNNFMILASEEAPEQALKELKRLQETNPEFSAIPAQIGMIYMQNNNFQEAVKYLGRAVSLEPNNISYQYNLAVLLDHMGYGETASKLYYKLLEEARNGKELPVSYLKIQERITNLASK